MQELILTSQENLRQLITECLNKNNQLSIPITQPEPVKFLYSISELAKFLNCSTVTAQKIKNSGRIRYKQIGRKLIFNTVEVLEDLAKTKKRA